MKIIFRFVLTDCKDAATYKKNMEDICKCDLVPYPVIKNADDCTVPATAVEALKQIIWAVKDVKIAALQVIRSEIDGQATPFHFIIMLLMYTTQNGKNKKVIEANLKQHIRTGYYRESFLVEFYSKYKTVIFLISNTCA